MSNSKIREAAREIEAAMTNNASHPVDATLETILADGMHIVALKSFEYDEAGNLRLTWANKDGIVRDRISAKLVEKVVESYKIKAGLRSYKECGTVNNTLKYMMAHKVLMYADVSTNIKDVDGSYAIYVNVKILISKALYDAAQKSKQ